MTPRHIYQTWKTKDEKKIPKKFLEYSRRWKELHPDFEYTLLDDDDLRNIVKDIVPHYLIHYDNFSQTIERVDFARYALLYGYGGVYADMDTFPVKNLGRWVSTNKIVLGCEPDEHSKRLYSSREKVLCNAVMISPPHQKYWLDLMKYIIDNYEANYLPVYTTGPMAMTKLYEDYPEVYNDIIITDPCVFFPLTADGKVTKGCDVNKETYTMHVWDNTWAYSPLKDPRIRNTRYQLAALFILLFIVCVYFMYAT